MADHCLLCGKELGRWDSGSAEICGIAQPLCRDCKKRYKRAEGEEKEALLQRLMSSPGLVDRDYIRQVLDREAEQRRLREEKEQRDARIREVRARRQSEQLNCCGFEMDALGVVTFQLGEYSLLLGDLSHLAAGSLELAMFRCPCCGQVKFFDPGIIQR